MIYLVHRRGGGEEGSTLCLPWHLPLGKEVVWDSCGLLDVSLGGDG